MDPNKIKKKIGFIGGGNMATAIIEGIVRKEIVTRSQIYVSAPSEATVRYWNDRGINACYENGKVAEEADIIVLAIKPHILPAAVAGIYKTLTNPAKVTNKLFVSILAGITLESLENVLAGFEGKRVIRVMPNTPMMVSEGCSGYSPGQTATEEDIKIVQQMLSSSGMCNLVPESMMDAVVGLSGSGPAYVYVVIEALSDAGVKMGIPRAMSTRFAAQTVLGAAKMVLETGKHTGTLKDEVCSPGGTTITAVHSLERGGLRTALMDAVEAATQKSIELGQKHGVKMGIPRAMSTQFAAQTVLGAAKTVLETGKHTGTLKDEVCLPGGTTITTIHALEKGGLRAALMDAVESATQKSIDLGQKYGNTKTK